MAEVIRAKLRAGADPEAVRERTGVLLGEDFRPLNLYNLGGHRASLLREDADVEIEAEAFHAMKSDPTPAPAKKKAKGVADEVE